MNFTPEVVAALAVLRNAAENDFERHRLDVLERDLTAPPKVKVIDEKTQSFNGVAYHVNNSGHFDKHLIQLHRVVWKYCIGDIPKGMHVHHRDENKANNHISNLQLLTPAEHKALHRRTAKKKEYTCEFCGKKFLSSSTNLSRFCFQKCNNAWQRKNKQEIRTCLFCGKPFSTFRNS